MLVSMRRSRLVAATLATILVVGVVAVGMLGLYVDSIGVTGERRPPVDHSGARGLLLIAAVSIVVGLWLWAARGAGTDDV
jgi:uncharacterized membrane protein YdcZ (DUF606 family)